jgi:hypothetical protein
MIVKRLNIQNNERILKTARETNQGTYESKAIRITADFSTETLKSKHRMLFQALKENNCQLRLLFLAKTSFIIEGEIETFHVKQKLKEFMTSQLVL